MNSTTMKIVKLYPSIEPVLQSTKKCNVTLTDEEKVYFELASFFENPSTNDFRLSSIYKNLRNEKLTTALELIQEFFLTQTYLVNKDLTLLATNDITGALILDGTYNTDLFNMNDSANFLTENGLSYTKEKINLYANREKFPKHDLKIGKIRYWKLETLQELIDNKGVYKAD